MSTLHDEEWIPIVCCPADFAVDLFERAVEQLVHHPEYNSTLILRSETLAETRYCSDDAPPSDLESHRPVYDIYRRLVPRRPGRDAALDQRCTLYATHDGVPCTLVLSPLLTPGASLPYYHPPVRRLAFRFIAESTPPSLSIEAVVATPSPPLDLDSRLYRTSLSLLETLHRYGWGVASNYQKRIAHDRIIPREVYQDTYLVMRERYRSVVAAWKESTDPLKHVFEDIGIATYLVLLWKDMFKGGESALEQDNDGPCKGWPQPPGGFLDLGCGNGLLTHILVSEGYRGHGLDLRARTSWAHYPDRTRAALHVHAIDPTLYHAGATPEATWTRTVPHLERRGTFLIANHADELTPWVPLLATLACASGYLSIPCCAWSFDERFTTATGGVGHVVDSDDDDDDGEAFVAGLHLGNEPGQGQGQTRSRYAAYRIWLAKTSRWTGWKVECDTLRIPSTRNWAIVGRERLDGEHQVYVDRALGVVCEVVKRGAFKTRTPEGKAGDH